MARVTLGREGVQNVLILYYIHGHDKQVKAFNTSWYQCLVHFLHIMQYRIARSQESLWHIALGAKYLQIKYHKGEMFKNKSPAGDLAALHCSV